MLIFSRPTHNILCQEFEVVCQKFQFSVPNICSPQRYCSEQPLQCWRNCGILVIRHGPDPHSQNPMPNALSGYTGRCGDNIHAIKYHVLAMLGPQ